MGNTKQITLLNILEGYVRNYRRLNIHTTNNWSTITSREIGYFANVGEYLGFFTYMEDTKPNHDYGRSRPMDLAWWKWDERFSKEEFVKLVLHLERENQTSKDIETLDKLFCTTDERYIPDFVIGIMNVTGEKRVNELINDVKKRNETQGSEVLMIFQYFDDEKQFHRLFSYYLDANCKNEDSRNLISVLDDSEYWMMCFEEEYRKN